MPNKTWYRFFRVILGATTTHIKIHFSLKISFSVAILIIFKISTLVSILQQILFKGNQIQGIKKFGLWTNQIHVFGVLVLAYFESLWARSGQKSELQLKPNTPSSILWTCPRWCLIICKMNLLTLLTRYWEDFKNVPILDFLDVFSGIKEYIVQ